MLNCREKKKALRGDIESSSITYVVLVICESLLLSLELNVSLFKDSDKRSLTEIKEHNQHFHKQTVVFDFTSIPT